MHVFIDEECKNREKTKTKLKEPAKRYGIEKIVFRYVQGGIIEFAASGDPILGKRKGTLSGFVTSNGNLYALTAKHVAGDVGQCCFIKDGNRLGMVKKISENMDIAAVLVDESNFKRRGRKHSNNTLSS